jgi:hypothetical protein
MSQNSMSSMSGSTPKSIHDYVCSQAEISEKVMYVPLRDCFALRV